ncbi:MAG: hypothetical protein NVV74_15395 [Magnetospirillum sp.]|nr:hypothetical protein [Magnetospirillum sp.]
MKTIRLFALAIPALAVLATAPVQAADITCKDNVAQVQKEWDKMYPMGMDRGSSSNYKQVTESFRRAKELCGQGKSTEATQYLEVVRGHLHMPQLLGANNSGRVPAETLHSDGPSEHHDAKTTPAMGGTPGPAAPETMHSDGPSTHHDPQLKAE